MLTVDVGGDVDLRADLTMRAGNGEAVAAAIERFGRLDAVIPNAGFQHVAPIEDFPEDRWDAVIALLLTSPFLFARYARPHLIESRAGRFVAIASVHGLVASPYKAAYVSAKHGVLGSSRRWRSREPSTGSASAPVSIVCAHAARGGPDRRPGQNMNNRFETLPELPRDPPTARLPEPLARGAEQSSGVRPKMGEASTAATVVGI